MSLSGNDQKTTKVNRGIVGAYCYPVIMLDLLLMLWCRAIKQSELTAIVQQ